MEGVRIQQKGSTGKEGRKGFAGDSAEMPKDPSEAGGATAALLSQEGH